MKLFSVWRPLNLHKESVQWKTHHDLRKQLDIVKTGVISTCPPVNVKQIQYEIEAAIQNNKTN